ncbi:MAG: sulfatase-like hydrolase/transferase, partial [Gammaproteobacteria bacterium]|nr:sulfatase-like hydrolase/transferase [Gammaproteobacteria bacterium]
MENQKMPISNSTLMVRGLGAIALAVSFTVQATTAQEYDRSVLPIPNPQTPPIREMDARKATKPAPFEVKAPEGAPNVVVVLIDDIGFGATAPFGGAIETPTFERLAQNGLRFNRFHTTAICSPTRSAL